LVSAVLRSVRIEFVVALLVGALVGCSKRPTEARATIAKAAPPTTEINEAPGAFDPADPKHGTRKLMNLDAPVYVDGVETAVLRYGDLVITPKRILEGDTPEYSVYDYLKSIGVAPESVKSVHLHGNNDRVASVEGSELVKEKDRFTFAFASQTTGAPLQRWSTGGLKNTFVVHEIRKVSVFVKKAPVAIHPRKRCHLDPNGACMEGTPYVDGAPVHGTRIYVDGKMVGFVKRRQIADSVVMGKTESGDYEYNVAKFVESLGVKVDGIKGVELVAGDDVIARASSEQFDRLAPSLFFTLPKHNHGKVRVHVPAELQAKDANPEERDALVSSVHLYKRANVQERALATISEDTDLSVRLASNDEGREGLDR
jgi:hypothetical protein